MNSSEQSTADEPLRDSAHSRPNAASVAGAFFNAFDQLGKAIAPPENADKHFRLARKHALMGIRELIDNRINELSRSEKAGTRVVVE